MQEKSKRGIELSAQEAIEILEEDMQAAENGVGEGEEKQIVGAIFDQDEARKFLEWLINRKQA